MLTSPEIDTRVSFVLIVKFMDFKSTSRLLRGLGLLVRQIVDLGVPAREINLKGLPFSPKTRFGYTGVLSGQNDASAQNDVVASSS